MPPKTFICSICKASITKPKSYSMGNGKRACRIHQEAQSTHIKNEKIKKQDITASINASERRKEHDRKKHDPQEQAKRLEEASKLRCWSCTKEAILEQEMFLELLKQNKMAQTMGNTPNPFDWNNVAYRATRKKFEGKVPIRYYNLPNGPSRKTWMDRNIRKRFHIAASIIEVAPLCYECANTSGIYTPPVIPDLSTEAMFTFAAIMDKVLEEQMPELAALKGTSLS